MVVRRSWPPGVLDGLVYVGVLLAILITAAVWRLLGL